ncbi:MAG: hypothetical protein QXE05_01505 [Nitrososphaeria archaeon]
MGRIEADGTIRAIVQRKKPDEARNVFLKLVDIAKKLREFDEKRETFDVEIVLILHFSSVRGAIKALSEYLGIEKIRTLSDRLGENVAAPYIGFYLRDFGKSRQKETIDIDIEPSSRDTQRY